MDSNVYQYWATVPSNEIADEILEKADDYYEYITLSGRLYLYRRSWAYYYRPRLTGARINPAGEQGELTTLSVNHYRNLLVHLETMTCQQRPAFEPRATNSDVESQAQCILATGLLDYYMRDKRLERYLKQALKDALLYSEGFVRVNWDATSGQVYGKTPTGAPVYEGDVKYSTYNPMNVIRDFTNTNPDRDDWVILRDFQSKYELAAKYPDLRDKILDDNLDISKLVRTTMINGMWLENSDNIIVYTLLHKPTAAAPNGRYTMCLDNGTVLMDGPIPYKETHVYRIAPDEESGSIFGYTVAFDLLSVQEMLDICYSTVATNQSAFGVQNVLSPKGSDLSVSQMSGGMNMLEYDPKVGKPEAMNLTQTPPEIFNFIQMLEQVQETISGVNSAARGNPEASLKSGSAIAFVQSMAIQFSMNLQQSWAQLIEDTGTGTIHLLQDFAAVPRVAMIAGKANRPLMKEFSGKDLSGVNRVMVDMGNPLMKTLAGRVDLADKYLEKGFVDNPDQYIQVVTTGRVEQIIQGKQSQNLLIKAENEGLADGQPQRALITDNHDLHIIEHAAVLANPEIRSTPDNPIVQVTLAHIQEHLDMKRTTPPDLLAILHQSPNQMPPQGGPSLPPPPESTTGVQAPEQPRMPSPPQGADPMSAAIIQQQQGV